MMQIHGYILFQIVQFAHYIQQSIVKLHELKMENLPPFLHPAKTLVDTVYATYDKIREDVMTFYNVSTFVFVKTVT